MNNCDISMNYDDYSFNNISVSYNNNFVRPQINYGNTLNNQD